MPLPFKQQEQKGICLSMSLKKHKTGNGKLFYSLKISFKLFARILRESTLSGLLWVHCILVRRVSCGKFQPNSTWKIVKDIQFMQ